MSMTMEAIVVRTSRIAFAFTVLCVSGTAAQDPKAAAAAFVDANLARFESAAMKIWELAEVGYQEVQSVAILQAELRQAGFAIESGIAGMPTAFIAEWGTGGPVLAILAEYDALPGITQAAEPVRAPIVTKLAGHACGHHLFGAGSVAAAIAVKEWLAGSGEEGTIRLYGSPAEEGGSGKVYLARSGEFADVDAVLHWHADDENDASPATSLANVSVKFRFHGVSAHAAGFPERGRSALDGVEAMNFMVNLMREHVPQESRIHYVITHGGSAPNVVPDFAEVYYYARHPDATIVKDLFDRIVLASEGAARGTGTKVEHEIIGGVHSLLPNETLAKVMDANLRKVGGVSYDADERRFAQEIRTTLPADALPLGSEAEVQTFVQQQNGGSTDVGDVSWRVPTAGLRAATWVPGTASHSWQAVAAGGTSIGIKGMVVAAKTLAMTAIDLFQQPSVLEMAKAEFNSRIPAGFAYRPLVGDRDPPLDYRK
jgi:aminobenzoyl-glutamate utilization protein B